MSDRCILIVNDDGLHSAGMLHLEEQLSHRFEVWAVCPDRERSATSQAITIRETLRLTHVSGRHYHLNGFPADCVNVALYSGLFPRFDLVVSGINHGVNMGDDVHYSGTVGAARHAAVHNIPAIAVSCVHGDDPGLFRRPARWVSEWLQLNLDRLRPEIVYNINYPREAPVEPAGEGSPDGVHFDAPFPEAEITVHGRRIYRDSYELIEGTGDEATGSGIYRLKETIMGREVRAGSDFHALERGHISITPLKLNTTDLDEMQAMSRLAVPL